MVNNFQGNTKPSRRTILRGMLSAAALASSPGLALAKSGGLFSDDPGKSGGAFSGLAEKLGKKSQAIGKRGKYAQVLFEDMQKGNDKARLELYTRAQEGDDQARVLIGWMFDNGFHAARNSVKAAEMFLLAAPKIPLANYNLGVLFLHGRGVGQNPTRAMHYFNKAERISPAYVQLTYYALRENKGNTALHFAEIAAKQKNPAGLYLYARLLLEKGESVKAVRMMSDAASANYPEAVASMSVIYEKGLGVTPNAASAAGWWLVDQVLNHNQSLEQAEQALSQYNITRQDRSKAKRFARSWLINRTALPEFDYTKTLNFDDLKGTGARLL